MKPTDLYLELAKGEAAVNGCINAEEKARYEQAQEALRSRAASVFDRFEALGVVNIEERILKQPGSREGTRVTKKIFEFSLSAPHQLTALIDPQQEALITIDVKFGCHDLSSHNYGSARLESSRCKSLDILTTVSRCEDDGYGYDVLQRLERSNYMHPVLDDPIDPDSIIDQIPERDHFRPEDYMHRVEGFHGALDLAEQYLAQSEPA